MTAPRDPSAIPAPDAPGPQSSTVTVRVEGDLDYETCDALLAAVAEAVAARPTATALRLDCAAMTLCDSMGLSALLQLRRQTEGTGQRLLIDRRPPHLDRLLQLTGTHDYLLGPSDPS
ncbi:antagonist protein [Kitasatospora sp. MMS16-BH015]|uniref:STAS domain-containing protein n=1 Tax=Kitasatospora sp. MMS16-BH015 TaxID=2018025 RepID=UPI000CA22001|nr:STAS domain-containing protein [Kitasatospora sp. MMS16-BH015]AUG75318.1 antagonist protein [Kitasatospora sp. MMS16-BH015]